MIGMFRLEMRLRVALAAALILAGASVPAIAHSLGEPGPGDGVAVRVDGYEITTADVAHRMKALQALYGVQPPEGGSKSSEFAKDTAKAMVFEHLMQEAAVDRGIVLADRTVHEALARLVEERYSDGGRPAFVRALADFGASETQVLNEIKQQMLVGQLIDDVTQGTAVSATELRDAFEERRDLLATPELRAVNNIVVSSRRDALRVLGALRAGVGFDEAARMSSLDEATRDTGGRLGWVAAEGLDPSYADQAFHAVVGQPFGPVQTEHGWNVGLVEGVRAGKPADFAKVRQALEVQLLREATLAAWSAWLQDLIDDADVLYADSYRPADPNSVPDFGGGPDKEDR